MGIEFVSSRENRDAEFKVVMETLVEEKGSFEGEFTGFRIRLVNHPSGRVAWEGEEGVPYMVMIAKATKSDQHKLMVAGLMRRKIVDRLRSFLTSQLVT